MIETHSLGSARAKSTTIDVSVNLLTEWFEERSRSRRTASQLQWTLVAVATVVAVCLPWLLDRRAAEAARANALASRLSASRARLSALSADERRLQPLLDAAAMAVKARVRSEAFLGEIVRLCNSAPTGVCFGSIRTEVSGGEATIRCQGEAESEEALNRFLAASRQAPGTRSSRLLAARPSTALGPEGSAFEYQKRIGVGP